MRALLLLLSLGAVFPPVFTTRPPDIVLTYLANMGVLIEAAPVSVVIDGFHRGGLPEYAAVPRHLLEPLEGARSPFGALDLMLTTHRHLDHFDAGSVATRLGADSAVVYVAAKETTDSLFARTALAPGHRRVHGVVPPERGERRVMAGRIGVTVLDLPHNPTPSRRVANVGFLIDLDGFRILHVGDADPAPANFSVHDLAGRSIDLAVVPFWYLTGADDTVRRAIGARIWVATHVPLSDTASVRRQVSARMPGAIVLTAPGERHEFR